MQLDDIEDPELQLISDDGLLDDTGLLIIDDDELMNDDGLIDGDGLMVKDDDGLMDDDEFMNDDGFWNHNEFMGDNDDDDDDDGLMDHDGDATRENSYMLTKTSEPIITAVSNKASVVPHHNSNTGTVVSYNQLPSKTTKSNLLINGLSTYECV